MQKFPFTEEYIISEKSIVYYQNWIAFTQAEAISDLIRAKTEMASRAAVKQLKGELSNEVNKLRDELINYCSLIELELDFSEEGLEIIPKTTLLEKIDIIIKNIKNLTDSYASGRIIRDGINLAIIGKPNARLHSSAWRISPEFKIGSPSSL